jgi:PadR family transcriptional regulator, regulatory protein PadR
MGRLERQDLFPGALEMMVLQTLRRAPLHGYALVQAIKRRSDEALRVEEGSLYPALQRMLKAGLIKSRWGVSDRNREVRIYELTAKGRTQLDKKVAAFDRLLTGIAKVMRPSES